MKSTATVTIQFKSKEDAKSAITALTHEKNISDRSETTLKQDGDKVILTVSAQDIVALRATLNAHLRGFQIFEGVDRDAKMQ